MKDFPNPFWALCFMILGCFLLFGVLFKVSVGTTTVMLGVLMAITTAGSNIISGAFGYINGVQAGKNSVQVPMDSPSPSTTQVTVTPQAPLPAIPEVKP